MTFLLSVALNKRMKNILMDLDFFDINVSI